MNSLTSFLAVSTSLPSYTQFGHALTVMSLSNDLEALLRNPPKGAWVERVVVKGRTYFYLRWREEGKKRSVKLTEEQAKMVKENLGKPKNGLGNCPNIPGYDEFVNIVEAEASKGDEDAKKLLRRMKKDKAVIERVLKVLSRQLNQP